MARGAGLRLAIGGALALGAAVAVHAGDPDARLVQADGDRANWLSTGRTYDEQRYSPLAQIDPASVKALGVAWFADLGMARGEEATPLVVDGVLYTSLTWSVVKAYDAATGRLLWTYDPQVPRDSLVKGCCDAVSRGVAFWGGKVYVATFDGRLIALDAKTGHMLWSAVTVDQSQSYTITGAPRVVKGRVIIGNGGAELSTRGYVSAYDANSGKLDWRFYIVPGDPKLPPENAAMARAMPTWKGEWWKSGGGGNAWDGFAYDPALDLLYVGTGNGSPWAHARRSPGGGDNLYLSSIVALRPETGEYVWHYQETPGDDWDYTATQPMILADLTIDGRKRPVIMHAPKNGFFYVLDRQTGKLLSAKNFAPVNWASGIDMATGRPIENPAARYDDTGQPSVVIPSSRGAHSWQPMSFSPHTGLVYIPVQETAQLFALDQGYVQEPRGWNTAVDYDPKATKAVPSHGKAYLLAWDPVHQREAWRAPLTASGGGALSTAGNLVFEGDGGTSLVAYRADTGARVWSQDLRGKILAAPISYMVGSTQYVAVMVGCGGDFADQCRLVGPKGTAPIVDRLVVVKLGGRAVLPATPAPVPLAIIRTPQTVGAAQLDSGHRLYERNCGVCHGGNAHSSGLNPDLRASPIVRSDAYFDVVLNGALKDGGMASFGQYLTHAQAEDIRAYIIDQANQSH